MLRMWLNILTEFRKSFFIDELLDKEPEMRLLFSKKTLSLFDGSLI
jgi:hypothetical protein